MMRYRAFLSACGTRIERESRPLKRHYVKKHFWKGEYI